MDSVHLEKRHGSHIHSHTANIFALIALVLLILYSLLVVISRKYRQLRKAVAVISSPVFLVCLWIVLCLWALLHHFSSDSLQIARRYGQIAIATATLTVFLSFKPAILPYTYQVSLVSIHKWIGRTSIALAVVHGVIYFFSYVKSMRSEAAAAAEKAASEVAKRHEGHHHHSLFSLYNVFGMIAFLAFVTIFFSSLGPVRRKVYFVFYALHRPLAILVYVMMIWHARPSAWILVTVALTIMAVQLVYRFTMCHNVTIDMVTTFGKNLKLIKISPHILEHHMKGVGSHVRVSPVLRNPLVFFQPSHPYTLVNGDTLVTRESRFRLTEGSAYSLFGPFGNSFDPSPYTHIIVIAGGSGVSMIPRFTTLNSKQLIIWITKNASETTILPEIGVHQCDVYITGTGEAFDEAESFELQEFDIESDDDAEASANNQLLAHQRKRQGISRFSGRPDFTKAAEPFLFEAGEDPDAKICVVTCGPESLVDSVKSWARSQKLDVWTEAYTL